MRSAYVVVFLFAVRCASAGEGLIAIAEREAEREKSERSKEVKSLILELSLSENPALAYVSERLDKLIHMGSVAVQPLLDAIKDAQPDVDGTRRATNAARALGAILKDRPDAAAAQTLHQLVTDGSPTAKAAAIRALGGMGDAGALPLFEVALNGSQVDVAVAAASALGALASPDAGAILLKSLERPDALVHRTAVKALAQMQYVPALAALLDELGNSDLGEARKDVLAFAGKQGGFEALDKLDKFLGTPAPGDLREAAIDAVRDIAKRGRTSDKSKAVAMLARIVESPTDGLAQRAAIALHQLGDDRGLETIIEEENRVLRGNPKHASARFSRAKKYYSFQRYREAVTDCRTVLEGGRVQIATGPLNLLVAACYAGMEDYKAAKRYLEKADVDPSPQLCESYPEFAEMAKDPRYAKLFEKK